MNSFQEFWTMFAGNSFFQLQIPNFNQNFKFLLLINEGVFGFGWKNSELPYTYIFQNLPHTEENWLQKNLLYFPDRIIMYAYMYVSNQCSSYRSLRKIFSLFPLLLFIKISKDKERD